jgi:hypothetical protein
MELEVSSRKAIWIRFWALSGAGVGATAGAEIELSGAGGDSGAGDQAAENKLVRVNMASVAVSTAAASQVKVEGIFMSMFY